MGYRAWFTRIEPQELEGFKDLIRRNPNAYGIHYTIDIAPDNNAFRKGLYVAWSGDGNGSLSVDMPAKYHGPVTLFLDDEVLGVLPEFNNDPTKYGKCDFTVTAEGGAV